MATSLSALFAGAILIVAGGPPPAAAQDTPTSRRSQPVALYREAACDAEPIASPVAGQVFEYRMLGPGGLGSAGRRQTLRAVSGDRVDYAESLVMPGMGALPAEPRQVRKVVLPTLLMDTRILYENAAARVEGLSPGQSVDIVFSVAEAGFPAPPSQATAKLTFVGCGVSGAVVTGAPDEAVRVYRLHAPGLPGGMVDTEFLVSPTRGWPIAERQRGGVLVLTSASD